MDLARELRNLREEVRQMRELLDTLLVWVLEGEEMDDDTDLLLTVGAEVPRHNN